MSLVLLLSSLPTPPPPLNNTVWMFGTICFAYSTDHGIERETVWLLFMWCAVSVYRCVCLSIAVACVRVCVCVCVRCAQNAIRTAHTIFLYRSVQFCRRSEFLFKLVSREYFRLVVVSLIRFDTELFGSIFGWYPLVSSSLRISLRFDDLTKVKLWFVYYFRPAEGTISLAKDWERYTYHTQG